MGIQGPLWAVKPRGALGAGQGLQGQAGLPPSPGSEGSSPGALAPGFPLGPHLPLGGLSLLYRPSILAQVHLPK